MKKIAILFVMIFVSIAAPAQNSAKAKALLDEVYAKAKSYQNIFIDFKYVLNNKAENINQETRGNVTMQGDKYLLNYLGATVLYDGKMVHTIIPENEEVTIEKQDAEDENTITPSKMLTFYMEGYKYDWDILQNIKGRKIQFIKMTPIDSNSEVVSLLLGIDVQTKHIYNLIQVASNNTKTTITVNSFKTNQPISKSLFTFNEKKYEDEGYYITRN
ncbi:LolA family protein [Ascidiimonas sp. W6]|uniref:LolA family protein n=1 Tax=Ascidiimonas meishanensis TaxID=3128903 RepID=UPI0030ECA6BB